MPPDQNKPQGAFEQVVDQLKSANNVLVTISSNPSVDQFAACIGLTLVLNKLNKHANAVFSGSVPPTIDFLKPEETLEKNTDSLRDFIIALDKSKADKLRYKVENDVVKIFITPYRTSISDKDLDFSQGDFNVDAVIAIGVQDKTHLDAAILAHGRILHDAAVVSINTSGASKLGSVNWTDSRVSSLCEMVADIARDLSQDIFDQQNATAFLTGIVAETDRFSNEKASPHTMSVAGVLMSAGASTQLVSSKLDNHKLEDKPKPIPQKPVEKEQPKEDDGTIKIDHGLDDGKTSEINLPPPEESPPPEAAEEVVEFDPQNQIEIDEQGSIRKLDEDEDLSDKPPKEKPKPPTKARFMNEPPSHGGELTANDHTEAYSDSVDPLSGVIKRPVVNPEDLTPKIGAAKAAGDSADPAEPQKAGKSAAKDQPDPKTLSDIEKSVNSPHSSQPSTADDPEDEIPELELGKTRKAVEKAVEEVDIVDPRPQKRKDSGTTDFDLGEPSAGSPPPKVPPPLVPES